MEDKVVGVTERDGFTASDLARPLYPSSAHHILREVSKRLGYKTCEQLNKLLNIIYSL